MNKFVSVCFLPFPAAPLVFGSPAKLAFVADPRVLYAAETDVALDGVKSRDGILAVRVFAAIQTAAGKQACKLCYGDAVKLLVKDVVYALLEVRDLVLQAHDEPFRDLAQKHACLARRVQKRGVWVAEQFLRQKVQHLIDNAGRGEHFVVAQVGKATQNVRRVQCLAFVDLVKKGISHFPAPSCNALAGIRISALPYIP